MLPKSGDIINLYNSNFTVFGPMMVLGPSKVYGANFTECYMIATGEKKNFIINHNSDYKIIQNANPAATNIVSILA